MKKLSVFLLITVMVLSFTSCSMLQSDIDNEISLQSEKQSEVSNEEIKEEASLVEEIEEEEITVESFLETYGFTADDLTPNHFVSFEDIKMDGDKKPGQKQSTGYVTVNVEKGLTTADDYNAWFEKLYSKMTELSDDGIIYKSHTKQSGEATPLADLQNEAWWEVMPGSSCGFQKEINGKTASLYLSYRYDLETEQYKLGITVMNLI